MSLERHQHLGHLQPRERTWSSGAVLPFRFRGRVRRLVRRPAWFAFASVSFAVLARAEPARPNSAAAPERIVLGLTASPQGAVAVTWRTNIAVAKPQVQVTRALAEPKLEDNARTIAARSETVAADVNTTVWHHAALMDALAPGALHAYRVGDGVTWSEWSQFRTAAADPAPFRFLYFGDPQNAVKAYCTRVFRAAFAHAADSAFYLIAGDLVSTTDDDASWGELFHALDPLARVMPGLNSAGNHDYGQFTLNGRKTRTASPLFRAHFTQPENGPAGLAETAGYTDYQGVRLVSLNGNERLREQAAWLDRLLTQNPNRWTIVLMHQPVYSTGKNRDNPALRDVLLPVFDKHAVDLVLQGHDHSYGRTFKLRDGQRVGAGARGTVYVVSATGPKFYPVNPMHAALMAKLDTGTQLFQVIAVDGGTLRFESWTTTGERHDMFTLSKSQPAADARLQASPSSVPRTLSSSVQP